MTTGTVTEVPRTYLEMRERSDLRPALLDDPLIRIEVQRDCSVELFRQLYVQVGRFYHWIDRLPWTDEDIRAHLERPEITLWVMYYQGSPAGYFELEKHDDGSTEIAYFGLMPEFIGRGLGKHLLSVAAEHGWSDGA